MKLVIRIIAALGIAVLLIGGLVAFELIPRRLFSTLPGWIQWIVVGCFLTFSVGVVAGYVFDSGIVARIFKKKP